MKIILDQNKCIGCGACAALDPKNFKMKKNNSKIELIGSKATDSKIFEKNAEYTADAQDAADSCPVQCISMKK